LPYPLKAFDWKERSHCIYSKSSKTQGNRSYLPTVSGYERAIALSDISFGSIKSSSLTAKLSFVITKSRSQTAKLSFVITKSRSQTAKLSFVITQSSSLTAKPSFVITKSNIATSLSYMSDRSYAADCGLTPQGIRHLEFRESDHPNQTSN
jgi:hypothetical protein